MFPKSSSLSSHTGRIKNPAKLLIFASVRRCDTNSLHFTELPRSSSLLLPGSTWIPLPSSSLAGPTPSARKKFPIAVLFAFLDLLHLHTAYPRLFNLRASCIEYGSRIKYYIGSICDSTFPAFFATLLCATWFPTGSSTTLRTSRWSGCSFFSTKSSHSLNSSTAGFSFPCFRPSRSCISIAFSCVERRRR